jgi:hypothetical protein
MRKGTLSPEEHGRWRRGRGRRTRSGVVLAQAPRRSTTTGGGGGQRGGVGQARLFGGLHGALEPELAEALSSSGPAAASAEVAGAGQGDAMVAVRRSGFRGEMSGFMATATLTAPNRSGLRRCRGGRGRRRCLRWCPPEEEVAEAASPETLAPNRVAFRAVEAEADDGLAEGEAAGSAVERGAGGVGGVDAARRLSSCRRG